MLQLEIVSEKIDGDRVILTVEMDDEALLIFARIGLTRAVEALAADGKALEWQEDESRQEEPTTSHKDSPDFFDLQDHFQKEK